MLEIRQRLLSQIVTPDQRKSSDCWCGRYELLNQVLASEL
jgi:hypothetical protein